MAGIVQVQLLHALQGNLSQARHAHVIGRTHTKANDFIVDALAQILFDAETQYVPSSPRQYGWWHSEPANPAQAQTTGTKKTPALPPLYWTASAMD